MNHFLLTLFVFLSPSCFVEPSPGFDRTSQIQSEDASSQENSFQDALKIFEESVHPKLIENCSDCHGNATSPLFAIDDKNEAFKNLLDAKKINFAEAESSRLLQRLKEKHNCGGEESCNKIHESLIAHIEKISQLLFVEEEITSYTSKAIELSALSEKELFIDSTEDRFIDLKDIFKKYASGETIKINETNVDLKIDYPIDISTPRHLWIRYKSATDTSSIQLFSEADENVTNQSMDIIKNDSDWKWIRINSEESKIEDSFQISVTGSIILDKILLTSRTVTEISNKKEVISIDLSDQLEFQLIVHFEISNENETLYQIGKPIVETSERIIFKDLKIFMNGNKSTKSSIFSDLDLIIEKGTHQISEATESLTLDDTIEDPFIEIFISRITRIQ